MGTDFTSMLTLFPNRSRSNLKSKFKREERKNSALIDKVLGAQGHKLNMADVEKDLAADKTLRRLVIQSRKYSPDNATSSVPKSGRRKKMDQLIDDDEPDDLWRAARIVELDPVLASSIPNNLRSRSVAPQKGMKNETAKKRPPEEEREENAVSVECESEPSEKTSDKLDELKSGETFKKPVGRPPSQRKRMLERKSPSIIKKAKKSRVAAPSPPPRIHTICLDDFEDPDGNDTDDSESLPETDHLGTDSASGRDDCFVIETNYEHESFNCIKTVKFSVDNPDLPMDVNATIEHKGSLDEQLAEFNSEVNESGDIIQVVSININQLPSYLEQTGAVVIQAAERE
uniref:Transcription factor TFIIIB component B'' Myb domain-containing protein n=2 Tax=Lygus hesperus TaxID=30085 RepID=A0A0A9W9I0_LYGHE